MAGCSDRRRRAASLAALLVAVFAVAGCATRTRALRDLVAVPADRGAVRLAWTPLPGAEGYVVERQTPRGEWRPVADATRLPPASDGFVDDADAPARERRVYRVATLRGGRPTGWATAEAVPVFVGKPLYGWLEAAEDAACRIAGHGPARGLQCALERLGGKTAPGADPTEGPHVLWVPPGTWPVPRTLWLEGRAGVQVVGRPGETVLRWAGSRGGGPDATRVLFHAEGNRDSTWRGLTWDGGCADPADCWVVAFDQSFCGRSDLPIRRSATCGADRLGWPERATVGQSDNGGAHFDSTFRNAYIGLRIGYHGVADDTTTHRRSTFENDLVGVSLEDFNALRHWFWDARFENNVVGITNNTADLLHVLDPSYAPGRCRDGSRACYSSRDCDGAPCTWTRRWAGDYAIFRGRFRGSAFADLWVEPTGEFVVRESTSRGSARFLFAGGPNATPGRFSLVGNRARLDGGPAVRGRTPGPFLLLDNVFAVDGAAGRFDALTDAPGAPAGAGTVDLLAAGNALVTDAVWTFDVPARVLDVGERAVAGRDVDALDAGLPPAPRVVDPLDTRPVYTVLGANGANGVWNARVIQAVLDAAAADPEPAIVHFPGVNGRYLVGRRLVIPPESDLTLAGDGAWTTLQWTGSPGEPLFDVDAAAVAGLTLRDLQIRHAGVVVRNLDRCTSGTLLSQVRIAEAGAAALVVDGVGGDGAGSGVDVAELQANGGLLAGGSGRGVVVRDSVVRLWSGITLRNALDFDVIHADRGADVLIESHYMENSHRHLRAVGPGGGAVVIHGAKIAPAVETTGAVADLDDATATIDVASGTLDLVQSQLFVIAPGPSGDSSAAAAERGARIRVGAAATARSVGTTVRTAEEWAVTRGTFTRVGGKRALPAAVPLPNVVVDTTGSVPLTEPRAREVLSAATARLRDVRLPPFYDEAGAEDAFRIRFDKVFVLKAPKVGLHLVGTKPCDDDRDCAGICVRTGLDASLPGRCG